MRIQFRRNVQVLRGIAVLLVVLLHFGIAGFTSGFLGVDVFCNQRLPDGGHVRPIKEGRVFR